MPASSIHDQQRVGVRRDQLCDLFEMQPHRLGVDRGQDQPSGDAACRAGGAKNVAPFVARIARRARAGAAPGPNAGQGALLADPGFVLKPDFQWFSLCPFRQDIRYDAGEVFLKAACAAGSVLGCSGRTDSLRKPSFAR